MKLTIDIVDDALLPDEIDVLTADDMWKGALDGPLNTHCLLGWAEFVEQRKFWMSNSIDDFITSITNRKCHSIARFNDHVLIPLDVSARLFNTVASHRYNVPKSACLRPHDRALIKRVFDPKPVDSS